MNISSNTQHCKCCLDIWFNFMSIQGLRVMEPQTKGRNITDQVNKWLFSGRCLFKRSRKCMSAGAGPPGSGAATFPRKQVCVLTGMMSLYAWVTWEPAGRTERRRGGNKLASSLLFLFLRRRLREEGEPAEEQMERTHLNTAVCESKRHWGVNEGERECWLAPSSI